MTVSAPSLAALLAICCHLLLFCPAVVPISVRTRFGDIEGTTLPGIDEFLGIPYAQSPEGSLRFADPVDWTTPFHGGRLSATRPGSQCMQPSDYPGDTMGEDCLFLNIWRPSPGQKTALLPVLFFVHGGSFVEGNGDQYNSTTIARKHASIVVTINYRLGHLGWLQVAPGRANFGLKDQRSALRWVSRNIGAFGGDAARVLLFGESAGAISVATHLLTARSTGLYHAALMESGCTEHNPQDIALQQASLYARYAGCGEAHGRNTTSLLSCLRAAPLANLTGASNRIVPPTPGCPFGQNARSKAGGWGPTVDGVELFGDPLLALARGDFNRRVALLVGFNTNEGTLFVYPCYPSGMNVSAYRAFVTGLMSRHGQPANATAVRLVLNAYPPIPGKDHRALASQLAADYSFICGSRYLARMVSTYHKGQAAIAAENFAGDSAFLYRFNAKMKSDTTPAAMGVTHGSEVPFVFDHGDWEGSNTSFTPAEEALAEAIGRLWASFARTGRPSRSWPAYRNSSDQELVLDTTEAGGMRAEVSPRAKYCDLWAEIDQHDRG